MLSNNSWLYSHKKFYVSNFLEHYIRHIRGNLKAISFLLCLKTIKSIPEIIFTCLLIYSGSKLTTYIYYSLLGNLEFGNLEIFVILNKNFPNSKTSLIRTNLSVPRKFGLEKFHVLWYNFSFFSFVFAFQTIFFSWNGKNLYILWGLLWLTYFKSTVAWTWIYIHWYTVMHRSTFFSFFFHPL